MSLGEQFDSVVMLTASNWFTEPRSNRYHYATRFACEVPVYFVQFDSTEQTPWTEETEFSEITIVHCSSGVAPGWIENPSDDLIQATIEALRGFGCRNPLVWVYNPYSADLAEAFSSNCVIYHATENYLSVQDDFSIGTDNERDREYLIDRCHQLIAASHLVVAVSDGVRRDIEATGVCKGHVLEVTNGVDAEYWLDLDAMAPLPSKSGRPVVLFQGGVNRRLDFNLVGQVVSNMEDWDFWFCGAEEADNETWQQVKKQKNVSYFGAVDLPRVAELARYSAVGWAPFLDVEVLRSSMPLKMYEYVACGLPVVSLPIRGLNNADPTLFQFATNAKDYEKIIRSQKETRTDREALATRKTAAREQSYDEKFKTVKQQILDLREAGNFEKNVLVLYDDRYSDLPAIQWHLNSFQKYSKNKIFYLPGTIIDGSVTAGNFFENDSANDLGIGRRSVWDFEIFDAIVIHYSLRISVDGYMAPAIADRVAAFKGPKILFIQDEYESTNIAKRYMKQLGISTIFTCVPPEGQEYVYPRAEFPHLEFQQTLTGYVPEDMTIEKAALPLAERKTMIGYRGRRLPHHYGELGYEKFIIGARVLEEAEARGIPVDIETDDSKRIYGTWHEFLGSSRATLGTESGSNIFDFDSKLKARSESLANQKYEDVYDEHFREHEGKVHMNQISPKFFEAVLLRTALICFPGTYSGVLEPGRHYIVLEKDFSNIDEVFEKLADDSFVSAMTDQAYEDIITSGKYSYRSFISEFDRWLDTRVLGSKTEIITAPIAVRRNNNVYPLFFDDPRDSAVSSAILGAKWQRQQFAYLFKRDEDRSETTNVYQPSPPTVASFLSHQKKTLKLIIRSGFRRLPVALRTKIAGILGRG